MKVTRWNSDKLVNVVTKNYLIDWEKAPSKEQLRLQNFLYPYLKNTITLSEYRIPGSLKRLDIFCLNKRLVLEYDGKFHDEYNSWAHKNKLGYLKVIKADIEKDEWCIKNNLTVIRIKPKDLDNLSYNFFVDNFDLFL